jgi:RNA polymerase sigma-70 factor (ECF subfamily)
MTAPENRIAALLAEGSPEGVEALYDSCGTLAYTLALRVLRDPAAAEDVVQESFLAIWRGAAGFRPERGSLRNWVCSIVRNRAIDRLRSQRTRTRYDVPIEDATGTPSLSDTWQSVAAELTRQELQLALDDLPSEQRETIELAYFGGMSQTEISAATETPLGTVKSRARLALNRLRGTLEGMEASWQS